MKMPILDVGFSEALEVQRLLYNRIQALVSLQEKHRFRSGKVFDDRAALIVRLHLVWAAFRDHALAIRQAADL